MSYMLSKQGYLGDQAAGPWLPHLMFFTPETDSKAWGADLPGSPIITSQNPEERLTIFMIPVRRWSDGTAAPSSRCALAYDLERVFSVWSAAAPLPLFWRLTVSARFRRLNSRNDCRWKKIGGKLSQCQITPESAL